MTKYFTEDISLYGLERMMMSVPRFAPRHNGSVILNQFRYRPQDVECAFYTQFRRRSCAATACLWLQARLEAGTASYGKLVAGCFQGLVYRPLKRRIAVVTAGKAPLSAADREHRQRFEQWQSALGPQRPVWGRSRWLAALFLLTSNGELWAHARSAISWNGLDFSKITLRNMAPQDYALYQAAKSIYTCRLRITSADLVDEELISDATFQLIVDAALIVHFGDVVLSTVWEGTPC